MYVYIYIHTYIYTPGSEAAAMKDVGARCSAEAAFRLAGCGWAPAA